ncbi:hypothetical protein [Lactobacillus johnsonii]|uniref:DUF8033 domain-containing protein n=1 Tax=Lactobacillus johnsonii TaxID=33959 RepID=A0A9X7TB62_LACJH|nr:hypothetical protein [Lactobacillus johnsonii]QIA88573.1 hypothetical protein FEE39_10040 [Lactobacillus johnsonii]QIA88574.1 hypothetical protein FEE39_10045 [Lactobacillus johnsonii]
MKKVQIRMDLGKLAELKKAYNWSNKQDLDHCDRKSFYNKAYKAYDESKRYVALFSYNTLICVYDSKKNVLHVDRYYINYSATTRRHQASFFNDLFPQEASFSVYDRLRDE